MQAVSEGCWTCWWWRAVVVVVVVLFVSRVVDLRGA